MLTFSLLSYPYLETYVNLFTAKLVGAVMAPPVLIDFFFLLNSFTLSTALQDCDVDKADVYGYNCFIYNFGAGGIFDLAIVVRSSLLHTRCIFFELKVSF
jgi:hypothetical protein